MSDNIRLMSDFEGPIQARSRFGMGALVFAKPGTTTVAKPVAVAVPAPVANWGAKPLPPKPVVPVAVVSPVKPASWTPALAKPVVPVAVAAPKPWRTVAKPVAVAVPAPVANWGAKPLLPKPVVPVWTPAQPWRTVPSGPRQWVAGTIAGNKVYADIMANPLPGETGFATGMRARNAAGDTFNYTVLATLHPDWSPAQIADNISQAQAESRAERKKGDLFSGIVKAFTPSSAVKQLVSGKGSFATVGKAIGRATAPTGAAVEFVAKPVRKLATQAGVGKDITGMKTGMWLATGAAAGAAIVAAPVVAGWFGGAPVAGGIATKAGTAAAVKAAPSLFAPIVNAIVPVATKAIPSAVAPAIAAAKDPMAAAIKGAADFVNTPARWFPNASPAPESPASSVAEPVVPPAGVAPSSGVVKAGLGMGGILSIAGAAVLIFVLMGSRRK